MRGTLCQPCVLWRLAAGSFTVEHRLVVLGVRNTVTDVAGYTLIGRLLAIERDELVTLVERRLAEATGASGA